MWSKLTVIFHLWLQGLRWSTMRLSRFLPHVLVSLCYSYNHPGCNSPCLMKRASLQALSAQWLSVYMILTLQPQLSTSPHQCWFTGWMFLGFRYPLLSPFPSGISSHFSSYIWVVQFLCHCSVLGELFPSTALRAPTECEIPCRLLWPPWGSRAGSTGGSAPAAAPHLGFCSSDAHRFTELVSWLHGPPLSVVAWLHHCPSSLSMLLLRRKVILGSSTATHPYKGHTAAGLLNAQIWHLLMLPLHSPFLICPCIGFCVSIWVNVSSRGLPEQTAGLSGQPQAHWCSRMASLAGHMDEVTLISVL